MQTQNFSLEYESTSNPCYLPNRSSQKASKIPCVAYAVVSSTSVGYFLRYCLFHCWISQSSLQVPLNLRGCLARCISPNTPNTSEAMILLPRTTALAERLAFFLIIILKEGTPAFIWMSTFPHSSYSFQASPFSLQATPPPPENLL